MSNFSGYYWVTKINMRSPRATKLPAPTPMVMQPDNILVAFRAINTVAAILV